MRGALEQSILVKSIRFALALPSHILIRRALGPELFGQYLVAHLALEIASALASLGMGQVVLRFLPGLRLGNDRRALRRFLALALAFQTLGWGAVIGLVHAAGSLLSAWVRGEELAALVVLAVYLVGTRLWFDVVTEVYHAVLDVKPVTFATVAWQAIFLAGLLYSFSRGGGVEGVLLASAAANVTTGIALSLGWSSRLGVTGEADAIRIPVGRMLAYGLPFAAVGILQRVVWRASEGFLINYHWGEEAAGLFGAAYSLPQLVLEFIPTAIWPIVMASFATVFALDREHAGERVEQYYKLLFVVVAPLTVGGALFGDRLLAAVYGSAYGSAAWMCQVFFLVQCMSFVGTPLSMSLYLLEKSALNLMVWVLAAAVNVGLDLVLIPIDWRLGGVIPVAIAIAIMPPLYAVLLRREGFRVRVPSAFIARSFIASLALLVLVPLRAIASDALAIAVAGPLGALVLVAAFRIVRVFRAEDEAVLRLVPWAPIRRMAAWTSSGGRST